MVGHRVGVDIGGTFTSSSTSGSGYTTFQLWRGSSSAEKCSSSGVPPIEGLLIRGLL